MSRQVHDHGTESPERQWEHFAIVLRMPGRCNQSIA